MSIFGFFFILNNLLLECQFYKLYNGSKCLFNMLTMLIPCLQTINISKNNLIVLKNDLNCHRQKGILVHPNCFSPLYWGYPSTS